MKLTRHNPAACTLEIDTVHKQTTSVMLTSDVHYDSSLCDLRRFGEHLSIADNEKSPVLIGGDFFDAMQGRDDPRRSPEELKEKYRVSSYFDALVQDASEYLRRFANVPLWILAMGNHESKVLEKINTNLLERLAYDMRLHGVNAEAAGYWGYLRFMFRYTKGKERPSRLLYWHHGNGASAKVTRGVLETNRQAVYLNDVDIVLNAHNHHAYCVPIQVERVNQRTMEVYTETVWYLRTPGYKNSAADAQSMYGFGAEKHRAPTPRGCMFLDFTYRKGQPVDIGIRQKIG